MLTVVPSEVVAFVEGWLGLGSLTSQPEPALDLHGGHAAQVGALLGLLERAPSRLIEVTTADRAALIAAQCALEAGMQRWATNPSFHVGKLSNSGENAVKTIWRVMHSCPDEYPPPQFRIVPFVTDEILRASIEGDIGGAHSALANDEFKAATVLAGAAIEALLLDALQQDATFSKLATFSKTPKNKAALENWNLGDYIDAARHAELIDDDIRKALELAKDYRNLIHPGRTKRKSATCNRGTTHVAIGAMDLLVERLARCLAVKQTS